MQSSQQIQKRLNTLSARHDKLNSDLQTAREQAEKVRQQFVEDEAHAKNLAVASAQVSALKAARDTLSPEIESLTEELVAARQAEQEQHNQDQIKQLRKERLEIQAEYFSLRDELDKVLHGFASKFVANGKRWADNSKALTDLGALFSRRMANRNKVETFGFAIAETIGKAFKLGGRKPLAPRKAA